MTEAPLVTPNDLPPAEGDNLVVREYVGHEEVGALREAQEAWLERRGIDLASTPRLTMGQREFDLFRNAPGNYRDYTRRVYSIPQEDQDNCQYALVDVVLDDSTLPHQPELTIVDDADFGTVIDSYTIFSDIQAPNQSPDDPPAPESDGAYITVDITERLAASSGRLQTFAEELMTGITTDPLDSSHGDIGVRAGVLASGQKDTYIWTTTPFTKSVELTIAFPGQYNSVCILRGQKREAANGKASMAQIVDPVVVLKIEGERLTELQHIYQNLYREPDFALTDEQRQARDELFNTYLARQISDQASKNKAAEVAQQAHERRRQQATQLKGRELPRP